MLRLWQADSCVDYSRKRRKLTPNWPNASVQKLSGVFCIVCVPRAEIIRNSERCSCETPHWRRSLSLAHWDKAWMVDAEQVFLSLPDVNRCTGFVFTPIDKNRQTHKHTLYTPNACMHVHTYDHRLWTCSRQTGQFHTPLRNTHSNVTNVLYLYSWACHSVHWIDTAGRKRTICDSQYTKPRFKSIFHRWRVRFNIFDFLMKHLIIYGDALTAVLYHRTVHVLPLWLKR